MRSRLLLAGLLAMLTTPAFADTITAKFKEIDGPTPTYSYTIWDTVNFVIPAGQTLVSAVLTGTWGKTTTFSGSAGSTANSLLFVDGILASNTYELTPSPTTQQVSFSHVFTDLSNFLDGAATLSFVQTAPYLTRLSETTLTLTTAPTAVPGPEAGAGIGALALGGAALVMRRRRKSEALVA